MDAVRARFEEAVMLHRRGEYARAVDGYRAVLAENPSLTWVSENLALALLGAGDLAEGFALYDLRLTRAVGRVPPPQLSFPEWRGEPLDGRSILVWTEQGLGDQILFARFTRELADRGARVSILAPPELARLFAALPATVIEAAGRVAIPRHDFWILPGSIPGRLGTRLETLPADPYLPGAEGGSGVGVAWRGDPRHPENNARSLPDDLATELLSIPGAISLRPEDTGARDFQDTADIVKGLARVVSVCTSVANLAGAMGKPLSVLLMARNCDWRWMGTHPDSPWYPTARLYRQSDPGDWAGVVSAVKADLLQEIAARGH